MAGKREIRGGTLVLMLAFSTARVTAGCADAEGDDPYALWDVYQHASEAYHFRYLKPPWELVAELEQTDRQLIAIDPRRSRIGYEVDRGNLHARMKAVVELIQRRDAASSARFDASRYRSVALEANGPEPFTSTTGFNGFKIDATLSDRRIVAVYHTVGHDTVVMTVAADENLDNADIDLLLKSLTPGSLDGK